MTINRDQLAYVLINPYTIKKSRTGGVITRLFTRTALDLVAARMFAPTRELSEEYAATIVSDPDPSHRRIQELIREYVLDHYAPDPVTGHRRRVMLLLFHGADAVRKVRAAVGAIEPGRGPAGETIRDTYGDFIHYPNGGIRYFEPAVLAPPNPEEAKTKLRIWAKHSDSCGGLLEGVVQHRNPDDVERTLVLLKPDNFRFPSARPGNIVDLISRTGLYIIAIKVHHMSVGEAEEFYGPVRAVLRDKLREPAGQRAVSALEKEFGFSLPGNAQKHLGDLMGPLFAENQFDSIVQFMTGCSPAAGRSIAEKSVPGQNKILALVYEGVDAVNKIRDVLGPTDPRKASPGTIRRELGQDIMVNAAHASDSAANAEREMAIVRIRDNNFRPLVESFYRQQS